MKANDDLILKDKNLDLWYKQTQYDYETQKISDIQYTKILQELHIKLLVHIEDVKNYHDSDSRLIPIKSLEERSEIMKKKIHKIADKYYPKTEEQKRIENQIKNFTDKSSEERVVEVFTSNDNNSRQFGVKLTSDDSECIDFDKQFKPLDFPNSAFILLEELVTKNKELLKDWANSYKENERDFYFFIYDLSSYVYFLDQLPPEFGKLKNLNGNYEDLLHDRVIAQLAVGYQKQNNTTGYEVHNSLDKDPDLHINTHDLEVKSIVSKGINHPDHFVRFSKSIRNRFLEANKQIVLEHDMIAIVPWSIIMANVLKTYYRGLYTKTLPPFRGGKTILVLEGETPFEDYYLEFPSTDICNDIREFSESGYKRISSLSYMGSMRRDGFAVTRTGNSRTGFGMTFNFT
ncbi:MAG: hypothetical protein OER82_00280 [Nitrosopumilus sp.]|nr:hypothetical protein [Nitrosopumilus sp.]